MTGEGAFHQWDGEYLTRGEWPNAPMARERVRRALGAEPLENARHLLTPIPLSDIANREASAGQVTGFELLLPDDQFVLRLQLARSVEMRLLPAGRRFVARDVWRALYALGLVWGNMDVFHWLAPADASAAAEKRMALFTVSASDGPAYFLPERAEEGETVAGLTLSFEISTSPAPLAVYDRMAVALGYLRQRLGGRPAAWDGAELDYDRLHEDRDALAETVREMTALGIAPGSEAARRLV